MTDAQPGALMTAEIDQQPDMLATIAEHRADIAAVAADIARHRPRFALLAARGSSDHAAIYAKYLIEVLLGLPVGLVSPSTTTLYGARPDLRDVLVVSVSQSGGSPDLLEVTQAARDAGARTVAVSNTPSSQLFSAADLAVDIRAGQENAVAATKTYTATLLTLYLLVDAIRGGDGGAVADIGDRTEATLRESADQVSRAVDRFRFADRVIAAARGYSYASALESSLKLAETSYLQTHAYSGADLLHGPVAAVDEETAVLGMASAGRGGEVMGDVLRAVGERGADVLAVGSAASSMPAALRIDVPETAEEVAPILEILPVQRLALHLSLARGGNPDNPRGLHKVTKTR